MARLALLAALACSVFPLAGAAAPAGSAAPSRARLVDCSCYDLFRIAPTGRGRKLLSTGGSRDLVDVSADRTKLLYQHLVGELDVSSATGANAHAVAGSLGAPVGAGRFSPDGRLVAYFEVSASCGGASSIHVVGVDGTGDRTIVDGCARSEELAWAPDSSRLAYLEAASASAAGPVRLVVHDVGTGAERIVVRSARPIWSVRWSPTGERIAYVSGPGRSMLHVARLDGTRDLAIAPGSGPTWSPNGRALEYLWLRGAGRPPRVAVIARDGTHNHVLDPAAEDSYGQGVGWSPNGRTIVYRRAVKLRSGYREELALARPDGTHRRRLLRGSRNEEFGPLYWTRDGSAVIYTRYVQRGE